MAGGGTTASGAFRYPYQFVDIVEEIKLKLARMGIDRDWEALIEDFVTLYMDRDRALEDYTTAGSGAILFATVAADGSGDYTTIKSAIEDVAAGDGQTIANAVIFVKPYYNSGNGYVEAGLGEIANAANVNVTVWSGTFGDMEATRQPWTTDGFASTNLDSLGIALVGFSIVIPANKALINNTINWGGGVQVSIDNCDITVSSATYGLMAPTRTGGGWFIRDSQIPWMRHGGTITNSGGAARSMTAYFQNCDVGLGSTSGTSVLTYGSADSSTYNHKFENCRIGFANTSCDITVNGSWSSGRNSNVWSMQSCTQTGTASTNNTLTFSAMTVMVNDFNVEYDNGNASVQMGITLTNLTESGAGQWALTDLNHHGMNIVVTDTNLNVSSPTIAPGRITGTIRSLNLQASACMIDVTSQIVGSPTVVISGHYNNARVVTRYVSATPFTTTEAVTVSGDNNWVEVRAYNITTPYTDYGTGNIINGGFTGTALTTDAYDNKGDILVARAVSDPHALPVGSDGQTLTARSSATHGVAWEDPLDFDYNVKGDLIVASGDNSPARVGIGLDNRLLRAASGQFTGVSWEYQRTLKNKLTANQASLETDTTGWAAESGCTIARNAANASHGTACLAITKS